jgi:hypothetical protein
MTIPDPEVYARDVDAMPTSAARFVNRIGPQWQHEATYSRGPVITTRGWNGKTADCVMVTLRDTTGGGASAAWCDGKYLGGFTWLWCTEEGCTSPGFVHPAGVPQSIGYRELCVLVSEVKE